MPEIHSAMQHATGARQNCRKFQLANTRDRRDACEDDAFRWTTAQLANVSQPCHCDLHQLESRTAGETSGIPWN